MISTIFITLGITSLIACAIYKIYMPYIIVPFALICLGIVFRPVKLRKGSKDGYTGVDDTEGAYSLFRKHFGGRSNSSQGADFDSWD